MKFSLRTLLILPFLLQVVGITGLVGYLSYRSGRQAVRNIAGQLMAETGNRVSQGLDSYLQIPEFVTQTDAALIQQGHFDPADLAPLEPHLVQQLSLFPELSGLAVANEAGAFLNVGRSGSRFLTIRRLNITTVDHVLYRYQGDITGQNLILLEQRPRGYDPHRDPPDTPWYTEAREQPGGIWRLVVTLAQGQDNPALVLVRFTPVYDINGQFGGVLSAGVFLTQIGDFLQTLTTDTQGQVFLMEPDGTLVATSTGEVTFSQWVSPSPTQNVAVPPRRIRADQSKNALTRAAAQYILPTIDAPGPPQPPQFSTLKWNRERYFVQATPLTNDLNWLIVMVVPESDFMAEIYDNLARTALLCGLALIGAIGLGIWTAEYITKPILSLQRATAAFTDGMAVVPPTQPTQIQEVEALRQGFDQMVGQLVTSFRTLKDRENTLATFLNGVPVAVSVHDPSGQMLFLNHKGKAMLLGGILAASSEQIAAAYQLYVAGSDTLYPTDQLPVVRGLRGESAYTDDIEIDTGERRMPLEVYTIPVFDNFGQVLYSITAFQDITERRQAEQLRANYERELEQRVTQQTASLAQSEATKQALINAIPDVLMRVNRQGVPLEVYNLDVVTWLGDEAKIYQQAIYENLPEPIAVERQRCLAEALATGHTQRQEYEFSHNGQTFCEEARIVRVNQDEMLVVIRDISERYKVDRLKNEFISIVSHELRTPLTSIRGALGILESGVLHDRPEKVGYMVQMALNNTERLIRLVNDILDLERLESGKVNLIKELCPVAHLLRLGADGVEAMALAAAVALHVAPSDATVWAAPDAIVQTLINLLSNAIKFSPPGSEVWLRADLQPGATQEGAETQPGLAPPSAPPSNCLGQRWNNSARILFSVKDQGRGIPADRLGLIFDRFQQVDVSDARQKGGTGLGLAICKSIVEQHGGEIWVESQLGEGSTFYFTLPIQPHEQAYFSHR
ncbi:MAG: ATP-binding protein [Nodosilinea sp.]